MSWWFIVPAALQAGGTLLAGEERVNNARYERAMLRQQAQASRAAGTIAAMNADRMGRRKISRAVAVAAASGGGVTDPTVVNAIADLDAEREFNVMSALFEGETEARGLTRRGEAGVVSARNQRRASRLSALGDIGGSLYENYGELGFGGGGDNTPKIERWNNGVRYG